MSSEQHVEDLLSAYLDNALTPEERASVTTHLQTCTSCKNVLADFRYFDTLLKQQLRVSPSPALRERLFSSPAYLELVGEISGHDTVPHASIRSMRETVPQKRVRFATTNDAGFVSIPGTLKSTSQQDTKANKRIPLRRNQQVQRLVLTTIAASLLLTLGLGSFIGWSLWQAQSKVAHTTQGIIPPQDLRQSGPLPAGMRFVFLQDSSLWSTPGDAKTSPARLTPTTVMVAPNWAVRPTLTGRNAGNLLAYIDLKQGVIHFVRSDGQSDTIIKQPLLQNVAVATWNTSLGSTILSSLSWSPDGNTLAFIAAPTGVPTLYTYTLSTSRVQAVALPDKGAVSHLVWAPDAMRIAFESTHNNITSVLDYNMQTHSILVVVSTAATASSPNDKVMTLDWATSNTAPALTWSVGTQGHIHSIQLRDVGVSATNSANSVHTLINGDYTQAIYSRVGAGGMGGWILTHTLTSTSERLLTLTLNATFYELVSGNHIEAIQWLADGRHISYLDSGADGTLHNLDTTNANDTLVASGVHSIPAPLWSPDGQYVVYSNGTQSVVTHLHDKTPQISLQGTASVFLWSATDPNTVLVALPQGNGRGYYVDYSHHNTATLIGLHSAIAPVVWTQIP